MEKIKIYQEISADVWTIFKKYLPEGSDLDEFTDQVSSLTKKYKGTEGYQFMQKLLKVYFDELNRVKG